MATRKAIEQFDPTKSRRYGRDHVKSNSLDHFGTMNSTWGYPVSLELSVLLVDWVEARTRWSYSAEPDLAVLMSAFSLRGNVFWPSVSSISAYVSEL